MNILEAITERTRERIREQENLIPLSQMRRMAEAVLRDERAGTAAEAVLREEQTGAAAEADSAGAVSYTHLDVYKRQAFAEMGV